MGVRQLAERVVNGIRENSATTFAFRPKHVMPMIRHDTISVSAGGVVVAVFLKEGQACDGSNEAMEDSAARRCDVGA